MSHSRKAGLFMNSYLYAKPSLMTGMASVKSQADYIALLMDWVSLGGDMRAAVEALEEEWQAIAESKKAATTAA